MVQEYHKHILKNGLVILGEPMEGVGSVAFDFLLPAGAGVLPEGRCGAANVIADWVFRGAGPRDSRQLGDALDSLGLQRGASVGSSHIAVGAALEASNLSAALDLYADVILRPRLDSEQFPPARQLAIDGVKALDDEPRQKVMIEVRKRFYPSPLGRSSEGETAELERLDAEQTRRMVGEQFNPAGTIFALAGKYDFDAVCRQLEGLFDVEAKTGVQAPPLGPRGDRYTHIPNEGAQVHIGLMVGTVRPADEDYYNARLAVSVLGGGMSARLFTEVREKRGLCYAIGARYHGLKGAAGISCYAGSAPDKAQQTLDVILEEFHKLPDGISEEEIDRARVGLKAALILQSESSSSRASAVGGDFYMLGRVRPLEEIKERIDATTVNSVLGFLRNRGHDDFTVVTIGPQPVVFG